MRVLIIEEQLDREQQMALLLQDHFPKVELVASTSNAQNGLQLVADEQPDLVLLNMQLPDALALELLCILGNGQFALICIQDSPVPQLQPIRLAAVGYLQKPVALQTLGIALYLAQKQLEEQRVQQQLVNLLSLWHDAHDMQGHIALPMTNELRLLRPTDILYCRAQGSYTQFILTSGHQEMVSKGLFHFVPSLEKHGFLQVSRNAVVNMYHVYSFCCKDGVYELLLHDRSTRIPVPRACVQKIKEHLYQLTGIMWK